MLSHGSYHLDSGMGAPPSTSIPRSEYAKKRTDEKTARRPDLQKPSTTTTSEPAKIQSVQEVVQEAVSNDLKSDSAQKAQIGSGDSEVKQLIDFMIKSNKMKITCYKF